MTTNQPAGGIKSVMKAVAILEYLAKAPTPTGSREVAASLEFPKSTAQRLLETLEEAGMVEQDATNRGYRLGRKTFHLGMAVLNDIDVRVAALPYMRQLRDVCGETVGLNVRVGTHQRMLVEQLESAAPIRFKAEVGALYPLVVGAPGKALLSGLDDYEIESVFDHARHGGVTIRDNLLTEVDQVRHRGYAVAFVEAIPDLNTVAVPIRDGFGSVVAALGASGPMARFDTATIEKLTPTITQIGTDISAELGHQDSR